MSWIVPLADIDIGDEEFDKVLEVLKSKWLSMGPMTKEFEENFGSYLTVKHSFAVANGTAALHLALDALGLGPGDEVIVPSMTFVASVNAVVYTGATPVFADITSETNLNIDPKDIEKKLSPKTRAILVVHYGGYPCDMKSIGEIANRYQLKVIEDCAHAPGSFLEGRALGTYGDVGCFSFFANKNMTTGEGGMVVTSDDRLAERIRSKRSHGMTTLTWQRHKGHAFSYDVIDLGYNYRLDEIKAALGIVQLTKLPHFNEVRRKMTMLYREKLSCSSDVEMPFNQLDGDFSYHLMPVLVRGKRKEFMEKLKSACIQTSIHYPPVHRFSYYKKLIGDVNLPVTEHVASRIVTLPLFSGMTNQQLCYICKNIG